jgi:glycosyltransferase involved in cell wall biosynthesis
LSLNPKWLLPLEKIFLIQLKKIGIKETLAYLDTHFNLTNAAANLFVARMIQEEGYPKHALHYISEAIKLGASGEDAVVLLGETQLLCRDYEAAEVNLSKVSSDNIYYSQARRNLCLLYWVTGQNPKAFSLIKSWPKELERDLYISVQNRLTDKNSWLPNREFLLAVSTSYLELLDKCLYTNCQSLKTVLLEFSQNVTEIWSATGRLLFKHHMADEAEKWLERGIGDSLIKDTEGALLLTRIYIQKKEDQMAFDCCRQILNANPSIPAAYFELADIYRVKAKEAMTRLAGLSSVINALEGRRPPLLSLCMIVKDEAGMLPRCLKSVRGIVDEIIIVDTGSVDDSPKIALEYGARIFHFPWRGDFSEARNYALERASGDWVLVLDADEELHKEDGEKVKALLSSDAEGFCFQMINYYGDSAGFNFMRDLVCRLFRNRKEYRFRRPLHEQVADEIAAKAGKNAVKVANVRINHYGYLNEVIKRKNKSKRNLEIIRSASESNPESKFLTYSLAVELLNQGKFAEALPLLEQVYQPQLSYSSDVALKQVVCLKALKRYDEALAAINVFLEHYPKFTDLVFLQGEILMEKKAFLLAKDSFQRCLAIGDAPINYCGANGAGSFRAYYALGRAYEESGNFARAADAYKNAAINNPKFHLSLYALAKLLRRAQTAAETAKIIETSFDISSPAALILLADIFISMKDFRQALSYLERFTDTENLYLAKRVAIMKDHCMSHLVSAKVPATNQES